MSRSQLESLGDLNEERNRFVQWYRTSSDALRQCFAVDELHDEERGSLVLFETVNGGDVRMVQGRKKFRFPLETREALFVLGKLLWKNLDGNVPSELRVPCTIDLSG